MVKDCETIFLAMPTCSEASLTVSPVEGVVQVGGMLHTACLHGHLPVVELLVTEYHSPVDLHDHYDNTPLTIAAKYGHAKIVKFLIDQGAKANVWHRMRKMAIHEACENGRTEVVKVLLTAWPKLVDVIGPAPDLRFPIHYACASKEPQLVKLLVEKGAAPKCVDSTNNTAFHTACCTPGGLRVLKELKPTLQDLKLQNKFLATCLHLACKFEEPAMVEFLIKNGADVNALNNKQQTPLHVACERNHVAIAKKLLKNGADVFALDIMRKPALKLTTHKDKELQKLLIEQMIESDKVNQK
ncbi:ankyrin-3-like [Haliotis rubra]|uniref:ankyrin-3-like n=1 Tax=Haliotis rubra TaxID=36100 RepID=UPI001EE4EBFE|nr:ankyrin-3-like [Haliotis rubra]